MERPTDELPCSGLGSPSSHQRFPNPLVTDITLNKKTLLFIRPFVSMDLSQTKIQKSKIKKPLTKMIKYDTQRWSMNLDNSGYVTQIKIRELGNEFSLTKVRNKKLYLKDLNSRSSFMM